MLVSPHSAPLSRYHLYRLVPAIFNPSHLIHLCLTHVPHTLTTKMSAYSVLNVSANESPPKSGASRKEAVTWLLCVRVYDLRLYQILTFAAIIFTHLHPLWRHLLYAATVHPQGYICHSSRWSHETNARIVSGAKRQKWFHNLEAQDVLTERSRRICQNKQMTVWMSD